MKRPGKLRHGRGGKPVGGPIKRGAVAAPGGAAPMKVGKPTMPSDLKIPKQTIDTIASDRGPFKLKG